MSVSSDRPPSLYNFRFLFQILLQQLPVTNISSIRRSRCNAPLDSNLLAEYASTTSRLLLRVLFCHCPLSPNQLSSEPRGRCVPSYSYRVRPGKRLEPPCASLRWYL